MHRFGLVTQDWVRGRGGVEPGREARPLQENDLVDTVAVWSRDWLTLAVFTRAVGGHGGISLPECSTGS